MHYWVFVGGLAQQSSVRVGGEEARVRVALHQRVYLELGVVEDSACRLRHVAIDHVAHLGVNAHLCHARRRIEFRRAPIIGIGQLSASLPIIGIGHLTVGNRPITPVFSVVMQRYRFLEFDTISIRYSQNIVISIRYRYFISK